jgi:23S rRNA pseudouridine1911/1915/1917 synthase
MAMGRRGMKPDGSQNFHVAEQLAGKTLAAALRFWLSGLSWSKIRQKITSRRVQINGNLCLDEERRLRAGDVVKLLEHSLAPPPDASDITIRYLDAQLVVVEKPAGMTTMRHWEERNWSDRRRQKQLTLLEMLPRVIADAETRRQRPNKSRHSPAPKPGPEKGPGRIHHGRLPIVRAVHRLDRDTSGLMVFARTVPAERGLVQQFRRHSIRRSYLTVVHGHPPAQTIRSHLVRDRGDGRRGSTTLPNTGQLSVTHIRPLESLGPYEIVECRLETGRTHQIRIHLSEAGHFVCGDKVYCQPLFEKPRPDRSGAPRLALHARELGFLHPINGEQLHFEMDLPEDLQQFIEGLRGKRLPT